MPPSLRAVDTVGATSTAHVQGQPDNQYSDYETSQAAMMGTGAGLSSCIKNDPATKTVAMEIVADWNQVARYAKDNIRTDIIDFNGYWGGNL